MRNTSLLLSAALLLSSTQAATPKRPAWDGDFHPAKVSYLSYSGTLSEKGPPKAGKQKLSLLIEGQLAQDLFDTLGTDQKNACGDTSGLRIRERGDVSCSFDKELTSSPYTCYIGVDLKTGKSTAGAIC